MASACCILAVCMTGQDRGNLSIAGMSFAKAAVAVTTSACLHKTDWVTCLTKGDSRLATCTGNITRVLLLLLAVAHALDQLLRRVVPSGCSMSTKACPRPQGQVRTAATLSGEPGLVQPRAWYTLPHSP